MVDERFDFRTSCMLAAGASRPAAAVASQMGARSCSDSTRASCGRTRLSSGWFQRSTSRRGGRGGGGGGGKKKPTKFRDRSSRRRWMQSKTGKWLKIPKPRQKNENMASGGPQVVAQVKEARKEGAVEWRWHRMAAGAVCSAWQQEIRHRLIERVLLQQHLKRAQAQVKEQQHELDQGYKAAEIESEAAANEILELRRTVRDLQRDASEALAESTEKLQKTQRELRSAQQDAVRVKTALRRGHAYEEVFDAEARRQRELRRQTRIEDRKEPCPHGWHEVVDKDGGFMCWLHPDEKPTDIKNFKLIQMASGNKKWFEMVQGKTAYQRQLTGELPTPAAATATQTEGSEMAAAAPAKNKGKKKRGQRKVATAGSIPEFFGPGATPSLDKAFAQIMARLE